MKKLFTLLALFASIATFAQAPQGFNYQATVRNSSGALIVNQNVNFKFNVMLNSQTSVPIFSETHFAPTDDLGQVNIVIGTGTATTGSFSTINWGTGNYYLGIELNTGSGYVAMGTTQLLSVPYALYANSAGNSQAATPSLADVLVVNNSANNTQIKNITDPTDLQDAATKKYIDNIQTQLQSQISNMQNFLMNSPAVTKEKLLSLYDIFSLSGQDGPGSSHIPNIDAGFGSFIRNLIEVQDISSDVAKWVYNDPGLYQLETTTGWDQTNIQMSNLYLRMYYAIQSCNNFLNLLNGSDASNKIVLQSETRFLRALAYYYIIDAYGTGPLITEATTATMFQSTRTQLFNYVESELLSIQNNIPSSNEYGRANINAVRMLIAKLYLNSGVYTGSVRYNDALLFINQIINNGSNLTNNYLENFSGDNNASSEIIFALIADAQTHQSWGNTTYIISGSNNQQNAIQFGMTGGWQGIRATKNWYGLFGNSASALASSTDVRAQLFTTTGHNYEMTNYQNWTDGFPSIKFRNSNFLGTTTNSLFANTDFPLFRYADVYLMYSECVLRGASGGNLTEALSYVNLVRNRSNASSILLSELTLSFILDERARELNFEGHRRTDLIRFGKFTGGQYLWPWKGGVLNGTSIDDKYNLFPIPFSIIQANPNFVQNPGY